MTQFHETSVAAPPPIPLLPSASAYAASSGPRNSRLLVSVVSSTTHNGWTGLEKYTYLITPLKAGPQTCYTASRHALLTRRLRSETEHRETWRDSSHRDRDIERRFEREHQPERLRDRVFDRELEKRSVSNQLEKSHEYYNWQGAMTILYWW
jgi:hypothetical protein